MKFGTWHRYEIFRYEGPDNDVIDIGWFVTQYDMKVLHDLLNEIFGEGYYYRRSI